jgi:hypothetical protein
LDHAEGGKLRGVEGKESAASVGESVGRVEGEFFRRRVVILFHGFEEYKSII